MKQTRSKPKCHSKSRVAAYVRQLEKCDAPDPLIRDFEELIAIDNDISASDRGYVDSLDDHFFHTCLRHNFPKPFDQDGKRAYFRPAINHSDRTQGPILVGVLASRVA